MSRGVFVESNVYDDKVRQAILEQTSRKRLYRTPHITVPGCAPGVAYADGDALGIKFTVPVPEFGTITQTNLTDMDKEALAVALLFFDDDFDGGTDNSAFDMTDADKVKFVGFITVSNFQSLSDNALGQSSTIMDFVAPKRRLYVQAVARGAQNLTASTDYGVSFIYEDHS